MLGPVSAWRGDTALAVGSPKQRTLLAILLSAPDRTVCDDDLVDRLWGEAAPARAMQAIHTYIYRLRTSLCCPVHASAEGVLPYRAGGGYRITVDPEQVDVGRFDAAVRTGTGRLTAGDLSGARSELTSAIDQWRGRAWSGTSGPFAAAEHNRLSHRLAAARVQRIAIDIECGRLTDALTDIDALVYDDPLREDVRTLQVRALHQAGRSSEAIQVFLDYRRRLVDELGVEPGGPLQDAYQRMLLGMAGRDRHDHLSVKLPPHVH